jgi:hypothetical protein
MFGKLGQSFWFFWCFFLVYLEIFPNYCFGGCRGSVGLIPMRFGLVIGRRQALGQWRLGIGRNNLRKRLLYFQIK